MTRQLIRLIVAGPCEVEGQTLPIGATYAGVAIARPSVNRAADDPAVTYVLEPSEQGEGQIAFVSNVTELVASGALKVV